MLLEMTVWFAIESVKLKLTTKLLYHICSTKPFFVVVAFASSLHTMTCHLSKQQVEMGFPQHFMVSVPKCAL